MEIFNPTESSVDLSAYSIVLENPGIDYAVPLSGYLAANSVIVITDDQASLGLQNMADMINGGLEFQLYTNLSLVKDDTVVVDKFGYTNTTVGLFDLQSFLSDPVGYLANMNLDLNDFTHLDLRRGLFVKHGDPTFSYGDNYNFLNE